MKQQPPKVLHWCLIFCFLLGSNLPFVSRGNSIYFVAVNDVVLPLKDSNIPRWYDGFIYLPYSAFDDATTGGKLGISSVYQKSTNLVTIEMGNSHFIFDVEGGYCMNGATQTVFQFKAVMENGIPYLPMTIVCNFFRISFSYHNTDHGNLVRLQKNSVTQNTARFLEEKDALMAEMLREYIEGPIVVPVIPEPEPERLIDTPLVLGFFLEDTPMDLVSSLDSWQTYGVFFFTEDQLKQQNAYLRKLLALGHSVGFHLKAETQEEALAELGRCEEMLRIQSKRSSQIIYGASSATAGLKDKGYLVWQGGSGKELSNPSTVVSGLKQEGNLQYLSINHNETTKKSWSSLMKRLEEDQFIPQLPIETNL